MAKVLNLQIKQKLLKLLEHPKAVVSTKTDGYRVEIDGKAVFTCSKNAKAYSILAGNNSIIATVSPNDTNFDEIKKSIEDVIVATATKVGVVSKMDWHDKSIMGFLESFDKSR